MAFARALANDPPVLLCDEPTGNLDARNSDHILGLLRELTTVGITVVLVTHDRAAARRADLHLEMVGGRIPAVPKPAT